MSGSGGGSYGGQFGDNFEVTCEKLAFTAQLSSPVAAIVSRLNPGDILNITQQTQSGLSVIAVFHNNQFVGGIASPQTLRMRDCLNLGTRYVAQVLAVNNGQVQIRVYAI